MAEHQYQLGERVRMTQRFADQTGAGVYEIVRQLPTTPDGEHHYRVKGNSGQERAVSESQLVLAGPSD